MQSASALRFHTVQVLLATVVVIVVHLSLGWQWSLLVPLVYAYFLPSWAVVECAVLMALAWAVLLGSSYALAPEETSRMLASVAVIIARSAGNGMGWVLPVVSLIFAALLGLLCGVVGSSMRFALRNVHRYEIGGL